MKKVFTLLLCAALLLSFSACSSAAPTAPTTAPATTPSSAPTQPSTAPPAMEETVLVDNDQAAFSVLRAEPKGNAGMELHVQCVNKSDHALMFSWDMVSVCGYMYDPLWAIEVSAGKTARSIVSLDSSALEKMEIPSVDEITFTLRIYDSNDWSKPSVVQKVYTIYPTGLDAQTLILPQRTPREGQMVVADDENVRFVIEGTDTHSASDYTVQVYLENKTDRNLMYSWDLVSVNDRMVDPLWAMSVAAGKRACADISFRRSELAENGITDVSSIEFQLIVSDYDDWDTPNLLEETYTYNPVQ